MIKEIAEKIKTMIEEPQPESTTEKKIILIDPSELSGEVSDSEQLNVLGLFCDVTEEKTAEIIHGMLYLDLLNKNAKDESKKKPIEFYISTYGGSADDMFGLYDIMVNEMEAIEQLQDMYCDALIAETKLSKKKLKNLLGRKVNVYLSAEEAVELGIADIII